MVELLDELLRKAKEAEGLYCQLVLVVAPAGSGKTAALQEAQRRTGAPLVNVNLELAKQMLELTARQRVLSVGRIMGDIVQMASGRLVLLDDLEMLFDPVLKQDPLRLLEDLSRDKTVIAAWGGSIKDGYLTYGEPGHPEYRRYPVKGFLVVSRETSA